MVGTAALAALDLALAAMEVQKVKQQ